MSLTTLKPFSVWITTNFGKFLKRWEYQTTLPASQESCRQGTRQQIEANMEQQTGSKLGKGYKALYCHPFYSNYTRGHYAKCQAGWITSWNHCWEKYQQPQIWDDTNLITQREELKNSLTRVKQESEKASLKLNIQKTKIMASSPITSCQIDVEKWRQDRFSFLGLQNNLQMVTAAMKFKNACSL